MMTTNYHGHRVTASQRVVARAANGSVAYRWRSRVYKGESRALAETWGDTADEAIQAAMDRIVWKVLRKAMAGRRVQWQNVNSILAVGFGAKMGQDKWQELTDRAARLLEESKATKTRRSTDSRCLGQLEYRRTYGRDS